MRYLVLFMVLIAVQLEAQFVSGLKGTFFSADSVENGKVIVPLVFPSTIQAPIKFTTRLNQTNYEFCVLDSKNKIAVLPAIFVAGYDTDGEMVWERRTNKYFVGQKDFDLDKIPELVLVLNDTDAEGRVDLQINIFKYFPPALADHISRASNWDLIGNYYVSSYAPGFDFTFDKQSIRSQINRIEFVEWSYLNGRFIYSGTGKEPEQPTTMIQEGVSEGSHPPYFWGTWKDENSTFTLNQNGTFVSMFDNGQTMSGKWIINRYSLVFYTDKKLISKNKLLSMGDKSFRFQDKTDPTIWNARKIN